MSNVAIHAEGIGKQYRIGTSTERYRTFRDIVTQSATAPFRRISGLIRGNASAAANLTTQVWALQDVSFEVKHGEVIGIIGRNGAGKSTLLKILSRITEPTTGRADIYGRIGALLEVGTGFHPELTGRENISLNAAILGMSRQEIRRKFDEIVAFAEVEKFIDTPVKHYSSGMALRLGFAVAAHLEPEILVVDEVLAVGDLAFQQKCLGKMQSVATEGRTVLFVSHNLAAVKELCQSTLVLERGQVTFRGPVTEGLAVYTQQILPSMNETNDPHAGWQHISVGESQEGGIIRIDAGQPLQIYARFRADESIRKGIFSCVIRGASGETIVHQKFDSDELFENGILDPALYHLKIGLPGMYLAPGLYSLHLRYVETDIGVKLRPFLSDNIVLDYHASHYGRVLAGAITAPPLDWEIVEKEGQPVTVQS